MLRPGQETRPRKSLKQFVQAFSGLKFSYFVANPMSTTPQSAELAQPLEPSIDALSLEELRNEINRLDHELLLILARRRALCRGIIEHKIADDNEVRDTQREVDILRERMRKGREIGLDSHFVSRIFHEIIEDSLRFQHNVLQARAEGSERVTTTPKIAFHGVSGSYCELAGSKHFENGATTLKLIGCPTFEAVVENVSSGKCEYGVLPVENVISGGFGEVFDLLVNSSLFIVGEEKFRIDHKLLGLPQATLDNVRKVLCSSLAFGDCRKFLAALEQERGIIVEHLPDSALAAKTVAELKDPTIVAIASAEAAEIYGLTALASDIANVRDNFIRYLVVARAPRSVNTKIPCKTSLVLGVLQQSGALCDVLQVFKQRGINLTKLENRPVPGNAWEEMFYLDFEGNIADSEVDAALKELSRCTRFMRVMGSYPSNDLARTAVEIDSSATQATQSETNSEASATEVKPAAPKAKKKKSYFLASRDHKPDDTIIKVGPVAIGGTKFVVMAGPCSVESKEQILSCARHAREQGATILRGGCFKPRTSPYSFQGMGYEGLDLLKEAGRLYGMPIITEVMTPEDAEPVARGADVIQIGARNMQNFSLLKAVGKIRRPVMLKRGLSSSIDDLLNAAEYILAQGNHEVILCERGIRTFETATRSTLDISAVPVLRRETHLPVIIDPSHAAGERDLVPPLALAAKAVGAHGIIVEFHPDPEHALSDGPQALYFNQFEELMNRLKGIERAA